MTASWNSVLVVLLVLTTAAPASAQRLTVTWGLENVEHYRETMSPLDGDAASAVVAKRRQTLYRTFVFKSGGPTSKIIMECGKRHFQLWDQYRRSTRSPERQHFEAFKAAQDPYCDDQSRKFAPELYFDFVADSADAYVLQTITVFTIRFSEYHGGGFAKEQAEYDLVLNPRPGTAKTYAIRNNALAFVNQGRAKLRFFSGNFQPGHGWIAPMGEYMLDIEFAFVAAGRRVTVRTGPFKIDV